MTTLGQFDK